MKKFLLFFSFLPSIVLAQNGAGEAPPAPPSDHSIWQTVVMFAIAIVFFYFILWRPEQKRRKVMETQRSSLKEGDRVTAMGIIGTVVKVEEATVILRLYDGAKMEVLKGAINDVVSGGKEGGNGGKPSK